MKFTHWARGWVGFALPGLVMLAPLFAQGQTTDSPAIRAALAGRWHGANNCGNSVELDLRIDPNGSRGATTVAMTGTAKNPPRIDALVSGAYDPSTGLLTLDATVVPDDPNWCPGFKLLGKCIVKKVEALGKVITDESMQRQKHQEERAALAASSAFQAEVARPGTGSGLAGTVRGASFDCASFQLTRGETAAVSGIAPQSKATESAALARIDAAPRAGATDGQARMIWLEALGGRGDPIAMAELGRANETPLPNRPADMAKAVAWYLKAAAGGEARAQRRLAEMYAKGQGVAPNLAESERWLAAAKATAAQVGRYCVAPAMIDAYMELFDAAKKDPSSLMAGTALAIFSGVAVDEGTVRIEGAGVDGVTLLDGPFTCQALVRRVGVNARNIRQAYVYSGEDSAGRTYYYDNSSDVRMSEAIAATVNQTASKFRITQSFRVQPLGQNRLQVSMSHGVLFGRVQTTEVLIDPATLVSEATSQAAPPLPPAQMQPKVQAAAPAAAARVDPKRERAAWQLCESATIAAMCQGYLSEFPSGPHAGQARGKLADLGTAPPAAATGTEPAAAAPIDPTGKDDAALLDAINGGMQRWSRAWRYDRYFGNSARIVQRRCEAAACEVIGTFDFARMNRRLTIAYTAQLARQADGRIAPSRICYEDGSTGMSDCADF